MTPWLTVIGIGEDGLAGLGSAARAAIETAELVVGGTRHQAMIEETTAERLSWARGVKEVVEEIARWRGRRVVVLASGDPMWYGAGAVLGRRFDPAEMTVLPFPGAFSLAAARICWPLADVETVSVHGRPVETLALFLAPGVRMLVLSRDGDSPAEVAALLTRHGFGPSRITVLERLGGPGEKRFDGIARNWSHARCADLNTLAIECRAEAGTCSRPRVPGLPDGAFASDGQLTKREVRAVTVAALAPLPGLLLWDVGAGCGSIAIEWLRGVPRCRTAGGRAAAALAFERDAARCAMIAGNATALGTPGLEIVHGEAPAAFAEHTPPPDRLFLGGGVAEAGLLESCWAALAEGGRLVANAVTVEAEQRLLEFQHRHGGTLGRIAVSRAEPVGRLLAFRPLLAVTQYVGDKR